MVKMAQSGKVSSDEPSTSGIIPKIRIYTHYIYHRPSLSTTTVFTSTQWGIQTNYSSLRTARGNGMIHLYFEEIIQSRIHSCSCRPSVLKRWDSSSSDPNGSIWWKIAWIGSKGLFNGSTGTARNGTRSLSGPVKIELSHHSSHLIISLQWDIQTVYTTNSDAWHWQLEWKNGTESRDGSLQSFGYD